MENPVTLSTQFRFSEQRIPEMIEHDIEQKKPYDPFAPKSQVQTTQTTPNNQTQNNSASKDTYRTYRSSNYGYTLEYPTTFTPQSSTGKNVDFKSVQLIEG